MPGLRPDEVKLVAALKFEPGFLLLLDNLQARLDDITDELADPNLPAVQAERKLRYWQAFREIVSILKTIPESFAGQLKDEAAVEEPVLEDPYFLKLRQAAQQYFNENPIKFPLE